MRETRALQITKEEFSALSVFFSKSRIVVPILPDPVVDQLVSVTQNLIVLGKESGWGTATPEEVLGY